MPDQFTMGNSGYQTAQNTVLKAAEAVTIGREVDRKANLMGSLGDLYKQNPQPSLEDLRAQYVVHGTPDDLARLDTKIEARDLGKFSSAMELMKPQITQAMETNNFQALKAIETRLNNDPLTAKYLTGLQFQPEVGSFTYTSNTTQNVPDPSDKTKVITIYPGDRVQKSVTGDLLKVDSSLRMQSEMSQRKAQVSMAKKSSGRGGLGFSDPRLLNAYNEIMSVAGSTTARELPKFFAQKQAELSQLPDVDPEELAYFNKRIATDSKQQGVGGTFTAVSKSETIPAELQKTPVQPQPSQVVKDNRAQIIKDARSGNTKAQQVAKKYGIQY